MNPLQSVALGDEPADLVVTGGRIFLPESGEFQARDVAVVNDRVAALPADGERAVGPETTIVNADEQVVVPGLIDAHTHLDIHQTFENAYHHSLEGATTTVVTECSAFGGAFGAEGVEQFLAATAYLPITVRVLVPPGALFDTFEPRRATDAAADALVALLDDPRVVGVGETDWIHAVGRDTPAEALYERAHDLDKRVTGHAAGCSGEKLVAFASIVDDDHESISAEDAIERAENGIHVVGRYGSIRDDIDAFAAAYERIGPGELSLSTDGMWPRDLVSEGHMDAVVRRAIEAGVDPADAIRMATLDPARHFGLADRGSLAPGNVADVVVLDDLETVAVRTVVSGGEVVVTNGHATVGPRNREYPERFYDAADVRTDRAQFAVPAEATADGTVRAIGYEEGLLSVETTAEPAIEDGALVADPDRDVLKATLLDRHPAGDGTGFTGFLVGFGVEEGAVATSVTWERPGVLVVGADDGSMRRAAGRLRELGGGWVVANDDEVVAELPLRIGATCSDLVAEETARLYATVENAVRRLGTTVDRPLLGLQTLTFPGVPALKLSFSGYADVLNRELVGLVP